MKRAAVLLLAAVVTTACRKAGDTPSAPAASASSSATEVASAQPPAVVPARCRATDGAAVIPGAEDLELGDAVAFAEGYAVALARRTPAGRLAGVALVPRDLGAARVVDLGPTLGDAPPPRVAVRGNDLLAAAYAPSKRPDARELRVSIVTTTGDVKAFATLLQQRDDSLASDLAAGLVAWDEAAPGASPRGVVRAAQLAADHAGAPRDLSPADSDAEMPRVVPAGAGYVVLWVARRAEPRHEVEASAGQEAVGEARSYSWLEAITLDAAAAPAGTARRLTPLTGHVSSFDAVREGGVREGGTTAVLVVARDDGESVDGSGGSLLRIRVRDDGVDPAIGLPGDGLGRGAPSLVGPSWLAWVGPHEELRLLPLDPAGAPVAPPSAEPGLGDGRPLLTMDNGGRVLVAVPGDATAQLKAFVCAGPR